VLDRDNPLFAKLEEFLPAAVRRSVVLFIVATASNE